MANKYNPSYFSGQLPVAPVYRKDENGNVDLHYCHTQRELDDYVKTKQDGGKEYVENYIHQEWPKIMSHPTKGDYKAFSQRDIDAKEMEGYSFDHFENNRKKATAKLKEQIAAALVVKNDTLAGQLTMQLEEMTNGGAIPEFGVAAASFTPQADFATEQRIAALEQQNQALLSRLESIAGKPARRRPGRKPQPRPAEVAEAH